MEQFGYGKNDVETVARTVYNEMKKIRLANPQFLENLRTKHKIA